MFGETNNCRSYLQAKTYCIDRGNIEMKRQSHVSSSAFIQTPDRILFPTWSALA